MEPLFYLVISRKHTRGTVLTATEYSDLVAAMSAEDRYSHRALPCNGETAMQYCEILDSEFETNNKGLLQ